jgi:hypothetical protein
VPRIRLEAPQEQPGRAVTGFVWADEQTVQLEGTAAQIPQDPQPSPRTTSSSPPDRTGRPRLSACRLWLPGVSAAASVDYRTAVFMPGSHHRPAQRMDQLSRRSVTASTGPLASLHNGFHLIGHAAGTA